jgi:hypothetical protein
LSPAAGRWPDNGAGPEAAAATGAEPLPASELVLEPPVLALGPVDVWLEPTEEPAVWLEPSVVPAAPSVPDVDDVPDAEPAPVEPVFDAPVD